MNIVTVLFHISGLYLGAKKKNSEFSILFNSRVKGLPNWTLASYSF